MARNCVKYYNSTFDKLQGKSILSIMLLEILAGIFVLLLLAFQYYNRNRTTLDGAPFVGLPPNVIENALKQVKLKSGEIFYDLGSGDGRVINAAALKGAVVTGIEIDPLRVWYSRIWLKLLRLKNAQIIQQNIFETDLGKADIVSIYLLPETHEALQEKLLREVKPGTPYCICF